MIFSHSIPANFLRSSKKGRSSSNPNTGKMPKLMDSSQPAGNTFGIQLQKCPMSKVQEVKRNLFEIIIHANCFIIQIFYFNLLELKLWSNNLFF